MPHSLGRGGGRVLAIAVEKAAEGGGELAAAGDVELTIDAAEVRLGRLGGDEQRLGDLAIA
jgi:hypothetical protein